MYISIYCCLDRKLRCVRLYKQIAALTLNSEQLNLKLNNLHNFQNKLKTAGGSQYQRFSIWDAFPHMAQHVTFFSHIMTNQKNHHPEIKKQKYAHLSSSQLVLELWLWSSWLWSTINFTWILSGHAEEPSVRASWSCWWPFLQYLVEVCAGKDKWEGWRKARSQMFGPNADGCYPGQLFWHQLYQIPYSSS